MNLISLNGVSLKYGALPLFDKAELYIAEGDRLAIIGRNGCGKTSLMKIIEGEIEPDEGLVERSKNLKVAYLPQEVPVNLKGSVRSLLASGLGDAGRMLMRYGELLEIIAGKHTSAEQNEFDQVLHDLQQSDNFRLETKIAEIADKLDLSLDMNVETLSAGLKRRALLGRGLVADPDILMLDEPTNHLDLDSVLWLEKFLKSCGKTLVFVSHDRTFLQNLSTRVVEVDRGRLIAFDCSYGAFVERREDLLRAEDLQNANFDKKLAQEEAWLRQGVKARRTRNEGRVRALMELRRLRQARRSRAGQVNMQIQDGSVNGQKVMELINVSVAYGQRKIIDDFSSTIYRGDKIGIIGRNGAGKTTLLNALLGKIKLESGEVKHGTNLQIAYFDQLRQTLDPKMRLCDFVADGADFVETGAQRQNIIGYLQNFLFSAEQIRGEIAMLSGGERNRLLLAKLFTRPANVLVLDEPTNDLDIETLAMLEEKLVEFSGTILMVSHDRSFLNNIVTGVFGFEEKGKITELVGGYDEWEKYKSAEDAKREAKEAAVAAKIKKPKLQAKEKFTNKEARELNDLPQKIADNEAKISELAAKLQGLDFIKNNPGQIRGIQEQISQIEKEDEVLFERWSYLEERKNSLA